MASGFPRSDLVDDLRLDGRFYSDHTIDITYRSEGRRKVRVERTWNKAGELGEGTFGVVWLERTRSNDLRALKRVRKRRDIDYHRELLAMATLRRVRP